MSSYEWIVPRLLAVAGIAIRKPRTHMSPAELCILLLQPPFGPRRPHTVTSFYFTRARPRLYLVCGRALGGCIGRFVSVHLSSGIWLDAANLKPDNRPVLWRTSKLNGRNLPEFSLPFTPSLYCSGKNRCEMCCNDAHKKHSTMQRQLANKKRSYFSRYTCSRAAIDANSNKWNAIIKYFG